MKNINKIVVSLFMAVVLLGNGNYGVYADEDYSNTEYWLNQCTNNGNVDRDACQGFVDYISAQNTEINQQIANMRAQQADMEANISKYAAQVTEYQQQIDAKQAEIAQKDVEIEQTQKQIDQKQIEIDDKQKEIDTNQETADTLQEKVKTRMVFRQPTMRTNQYIDILMGANTFTDFIRIANGLSTISQYDKKTLNELVQIIAKLNKQKEELVTAKTELETAKADLETQKKEKQDQQTELLTLQSFVQIAQEAAQKTSEALRGSIESRTSDIAENNALMSRISSQIGAIATSNGWTYPVDGAWRSAGTWAYPGGSIHLGYDFAAGYGTNIRAVANGVVLRGVNGCPTVGYLGDSCGAQFGGAGYSGNQVIMLVTVNGSLYGVDYFHMTINTPAATGTIVNAGDIIGKVGSSGNTTGPHCHVEIFYLGDASQFASYAASWNGDVSFGAGWTSGRYGLYGRRCSDGVGAPCRIRPEDVFGY